MHRRVANPLAPPKKRKGEYVFSLVSYPKKIKIHPLDEALFKLA